MRYRLLVLGTGDSAQAVRRALEAHSSPEDVQVECFGDAQACVERLVDLQDRERESETLLVEAGSLLGSPARLQERPEGCVCAALEESEVRFRLMADAAPVLLRLADASGQCVFLNRPWLSFTGRSAEEEIGEGWSRGLHPEDAERFRNAFRAALAERSGFRIEYRLRHRDGEYRWLLDNEAPRFASSGELLGYIGSCVDITERKEAETQLRSRVLQQAAVARLGQLALGGCDVDSLMAEAVQVVRQTLDADLCKVLERLPDGKRLRLRAGAGWREGLVGRATVSAEEGSQGAYVLLSREPVVVDDLRREQRFQGAPLLLEHNVVSGATVIIPRVGEPFGVLGAHTTSPRRFTRDDLSFLQSVANVLGAAIDRARVESEKAGLLEREQAARAEAEEAARLHRAVEERLALLTEASGKLLGSPRLSDVLPATLNLARRLIAADAYAVWRTDSTSGGWRILSSEGLSERYQAAVIPRGRLAASMPGGPMVFEDVERAPLLADRVEGYRAEGIRSLLAVPLRIHGVTGGTLTFYYRQQRRFADPELRVATALANLASSAIGAAELYDEQQRLRSEAEESRRRAAFLAQASTVLASSLDYEATLRAVAQLAVPTFADWCAVDLMGEDGQVQSVAVAHSDPEKAKWAREVRERYPPDPTSHRGAMEVLRTGQSQLYPSISDDFLAASARDEEQLRLLREVGLRSAMIAPLKARGRILGTLTFVNTSPDRAYDQEDLGVAEDLAYRAATAIDNARLYRDAQQAQESLRRQAQELERSNADLEQFAYVASHDLQEPLRMVASYVQLLAMRYRGKLDSDADDFIGYAVDGVNRMQALIVDLLAYSRAGRASLFQKRCDLNSVLSAALGSLVGSIRSSGATITHDPLPTVVGDPTQLGQLLQNLLSNAIKFRGKEPPRVHLSAEEQDDQWVISVSDNGIGIEPQYLQRVFTVFQRLHSKSEYPGTGIGLAICQKIVERHGGRIWAESEPGKGATFRFTLPRDTEPAEA